MSGPERDPMTPREPDAGPPSEPGAPSEPADAEHRETPAPTSPPSTPAQLPPDAADTAETPAPQPPEASVPETPAAVATRRGMLDALHEPPEVPVEIPRARLASQSRREFLLFTAGVLAAAAAGWWLLPERTKARLAPGAAHDRLDTLAARVGLSRSARERALDRALTFDDDVAEALYSSDRRVRTYSRAEITPLRNNYDGRTPGPEYLPGWTLALTGLASGEEVRLSIDDLLKRFPIHEQVTRLVCVEGWSAVSWWGGIRFADLLVAFPPAPGARWAGLRSGVNLDLHGRSDPYYVSIDLDTARHPQTLLATHHLGRPLTLAHGAPMRLLVPMKLGLKNIKAVTDIAYAVEAPPDYWNQRGYSRYDGL